MKCGRLVGKSAVAVLVVLMVLLSFQQISRLRFEHLERNLLEVNGIHGGWNAAHCRNGDAELVYAVMITGKSPDRELLARRALDDFWRQTHPSKALIVLTENAFQLPTNGDPCVLQMVVRPAAGTRLGQLRNYALAAVPAGAVWVQWDDDDGHHEDLMAGQLRCLKENAANGSLLRAQIRYYVASNITFVVSTPDGIMGTAMMRKAIDLRYPNRARGEDGHMAEAVKSGAYALWTNPAEMYVRLIHGHNTWGADKFGGANPRGYANHTWALNSRQAREMALVQRRLCLGFLGAPSSGCGDAGDGGDAGGLGMGLASGGGPGTVGGTGRGGRAVGGGTRKTEDGLREEKAAAVPPMEAGMARKRW